MSNVETRIMAQLADKPLLQEIVSVEPDTQHILAVAALQTNASDRWHAYEALKRIMIRYVGFGARCAQLRTVAHYETMLEVLDWLLPIIEDEYEDEGRIKPIRGER